MTVPSWVKALAALALLAAVVAAIYAYGRQQFGLGELAERAAWLKRETVALTTANAKIKMIEEQYRAQEQAHAAAMAGVSTQYQQELIHAKAEKDRVIIGLRSGAVRLRIAVAAARSTSGSDAAAPGAATAGCDGEARAELSLAASEFLVGLASESDEVARQLSACQAVITADRRQPGEQVE